MDTMTITIEEHEHRLYLPSCKRSLPKQIAGCQYLTGGVLGSGVMIRYKYNSILTADVFVYEDGAEYMEDGVDLTVFQHFQVCKAGIEAMHAGNARLMFEVMFMVYEYPEERQFCCAVYWLPPAGPDESPKNTHLFVRSVMGQYLKIRFTHSSEDFDQCGGIVVQFVQEVIAILKGPL